MIEDWVALGMMRCLIASACFAVLCVFALSIASRSFNTRYSTQSRKGPQSTQRTDRTLQVSKTVTERRNDVRDI